ncbi:MAG TPA: SDR family oxidoreductase [Chitinophagaceae bacterium]
MVITVFGATGQVGIRIVRLALGRGYTVKAFGRHIEEMIDEDLRNENFQAIKGYVFDEEQVYNAVSGSDVVLSALGGSVDGTDKTRSLGLKNIVTQMEKAGVKRIVAVGGMGVLNADENTYIIDTPGYPELYMPVGREHLKAFFVLQASDTDWTFVCPPDIKNEEATGLYYTNANYPPEKNNYRITAGDLALFMLNEAMENKYLKQRVGISN